MINRIPNDEGMENELDRLGEGELESKPSQGEVADSLGLPPTASWEEIALAYHKKEHGKEAPGSSVSTN
jgi:hypothetical protein